MKKFLLSVGLIGISAAIIRTLAGRTMHTSAGTSCKEVEFANGITACITIKDAGTDRRELETDLDGGSEANLRCDLMDPSSTLRSITNCNGEFSYNGKNSGRIKLRIRYNNAAPTDREGKPSSSSVRTYPQRVYDRDGEEWAEDNLEDNEDDNQTDNFYISSSPSNPDENERIDITVKARDGSSTDDSYRGNVKFKIQRRDNTNDKWITASSSLYELDETSYDFDSNDDGIHEFSNLVRFLNDNYDYRIMIYDYDDEDIDGYKVFDFGNGYDEDDDDEEDDNETDSFYVTTSTSSPDEDQYVDVTVVARDGSTTNEDYRGTVKFKVERKSGSSRVSATSSYYTLAKTSYTFTSSDNGEHEFNDLVRFRDDRYDYRLVIYDTTNDIEEYKTFYVNSDNNNDDEDDSNYDTDSFTVTSNTSSPERNEYVDITIKAKDGSSIDTSYRGTVDFEVRYKESGYSTRYKTTSLSDYEMKYPYENNGYRFTSSNAGQVTITDFVRFRKEGYQYKVIVVDSEDDDIDGEKIFTIGDTDDTNDDEYNFYLTTDDTTPTTNQRVDVTVKARDNTSTYTTYRGKILFEVYKKAAGASTRTLTTSTNDFEMASTYKTNGYTFTAGNAGTKTFTNLIKFKRNNYSYKVLVYDEDADGDFKGEKIFTVGTTNNDDSDVDGFTTSELNTVESIYDSRNSMISSLKSMYPRLKTNTTRQNKSDDLYEEMENILEDKSTKQYDDFDAFSEGRAERYRYTISVR